MRQLSHSPPNPTFVDLQPGQPNLPLPFPFEQKTPSGKILQPPTPVPPLPLQAKFMGQPLTAPVRVKIDPSAQPKNLFALYPTALNTLCCVHPQLLEDTELHPHTIERLVKRMEQYPNLIGVQPRYYIRGYPFELMAFKHRHELGEQVEDKEDNQLRSPSPEEEKTWTDSDGMLWCFAIGNACSLVRADVFRKIEPPWFQTQMFYTEDVFFYSKVAHYIHNAKIAMDMTFSCGHQLGMGAVFDHNAVMLRERYESLAHKHGGPIEAKIYNDDPSLGRV